MTNKTEKSIIIITGSGGLVGSEAARLFSEQGYEIIGIDNDMRAGFFGDEASTKETVERLKESIPRYRHHVIDIRDAEMLSRIFEKAKNGIKAVLHCAAQPSHDWANRDPAANFEINATGTHNLLEQCRKYCRDASFLFMSTNKVYGDHPNALPLVEKATRFELPEEHEMFKGIDESMPIDRCCHTLYGASKAAADIMVQEYGSYFGMNTVCFRAGCITGSAHAGVEMHGFLSYLTKCIKIGRTYKVFGYEGKQVRDNIHAKDLGKAFLAFVKKPRSAEVYNIGGGRANNISVIEAIRKVEEILGKKCRFEFVETPRKADHKWYISDVSRFKEHYPDWGMEFDINGILRDICGKSQS